MLRYRRRIAAGLRPSIPVVDVFAVDAVVVVVVVVGAAVVVVVVVGAAVVVVVVVEPFCGVSGRGSPSQRDWFAALCTA